MHKSRNESKNESMNKSVNSVVYSAAGPYTHSKVHKHVLFAWIFYLSSTCEGYILFQDNIKNVSLNQTQTLNKNTLCTQCCARVRMLVSVSSTPQWCPPTERLRLSLMVTGCSLGNGKSSHRPFKPVLVFLRQVRHRI